MTLPPQYRSSLGVVALVLHWPASIRCGRPSALEPVARLLREPPVPTHRTVSNWSLQMLLFLWVGVLLQVTALLRNSSGVASAKPITLTFSVVCYSVLSRWQVFCDSWSHSVSWCWKSWMNLYCLALLWFHWQCHCFPWMLYLFCDLEVFRNPYNHV